MIGTVSAFVLAAITCWLCWTWWRNDRERARIERAWLDKQPPDDDQGFLDTLYPPR